VVALSFCGDDSNLSLNEANHEVTVSMLFNWYEKDFCSSKEKLPEALLQFLSESEKQVALRRMIESAFKAKKPISVKYHPYDWTVNGSRFKPYSPSDTKGDKFRPSSLLQFEDGWNYQLSAASSARDPSPSSVAAV